MAGPLAPDSVSLRMYPHELPAVEIVSVLREQAALADRAGFDGVMTNEHHGGFRGYLPTPVQMAGFCLSVMDRGWAAPCPLLLPLRHWTHVAEELAWLAACYPGRVAAGFGAGGWEGDFTLADIPYAEKFPRYKEALPRVVGALRGEAPEGLCDDAAIAALAPDTLPLVSAATSEAGIRRAASLSLGVIFDSLQTPERIRGLVDLYRDAGGTGPCVLIRRVWVGPPPDAAVEGQMSFYRSYSTEQAQSHWGEGHELVGGAQGGEIGERLAALREVTGCEALNLRIHVHGVPPEPVSDQIERLGAEMLPVLRSA